MEYVPADLFGEDYLYFYADLVDDETSESEAEAIWSLLGLEPGVEILDVPCGHGRLANRLACAGGFR